MQIFTREQYIKDCKEAGILSTSIVKNSLLPNGWVNDCDGKIKENCDYFILDKWCVTDKEK